MCLCRTHVGHGYSSLDGVSVLLRWPWIDLSNPWCMGSWIHFAHQFCILFFYFCFHFWVLGGWLPLSQMRGGGQLLSFSFWKAWAQTCDLPVMCNCLDYFSLYSYLNFSKGLIKSKDSLTSNLNYPSTDFIPQRVFRCTLKRESLQIWCVQLLTLS